MILLYVKDGKRCEAVVGNVPEDITATDIGSALLQNHIQIL